MDNNYYILTNIEAMTDQYWLKYHEESDNETNERAQNEQ